jgi:serine/threonine protein kinase
LLFSPASVIYRDLKPDNIGFDVRGDVKIFDLGLAKEIDPKMKLADGTYNLTADTGSLRYMAPEGKQRLRTLSYTHDRYKSTKAKSCMPPLSFLGKTIQRHMRYVFLRNFVLADVFIGNPV